MLFEPLIAQARDLIQRLHAGADKARDSGPQTPAIRSSEFEAWGGAVQGIVSAIFGPGSAALARWHALAARQGQLVAEAVRSDGKRGEYFGMIDYFHLAIGLLIEFEAAYQHGQPLPDQPPPHGPNEPQQAVVASSPAAPWSITVSLQRESYEWLAAAAARRDPTRPAEQALAEYAATLLERVVGALQRSAG